MVRAWMMDDSTTDQRELHMTEPPVFVTLEDLFKRTGVEYMNFPVESLETNEEFLKLKKDRGYTYEDVVEVSRDSLPNYEEKIKGFFTEHLHADEEIRYVAGGSGYFDVRDKEDKWIRVEMCSGDMIVLPSGIYHRFTLDTKNYLKAKRLFIGEPVWTPINRPADEHPERKNYLKSMAMEA